MDVMIEWIYVKQSWIMGKRREEGENHLEEEEAGEYIYINGMLKG